jgi:diguanylate cyclase (GGDEF)-like protein/PAS domain S-box-containing protein
MIRLRAVVDVADGMVEAMSAEDRLAAALATHLAPYFPGGISVWLTPPGGGPLLVELAGHDPVLLDRIADLVQSGSGVPHPALTAGQAVLIDEEPALGGGMCLVPMSVHGRLVGVAAGSLLDQTIGEEDLAFATTLADLTAVTIMNARVLADATAVTEELRRQIEVLDDISDGLVSLDSDRRVVSWNAGAERIYGYTRADALGCDLFSLLNTQFMTNDGLPLALADVTAIAMEHSGWRGEVRERRADGIPLTVLCALNTTADDFGALRGYVLVNRDVTDQRREEHRALHDALTGLPNRRMLTNRLYDAFARACRNGTTLAVLFIDLADAARAAEPLGREAFDEILRATANRLVAALRGSDTVGRVQGEGFVALLENAGSEENVDMVAARIMRSLDEPVAVAEAQLKVPVVIGAVVVAGQDGLDASPDRLIEAANDAHHMAKASGSRYVLEHLTPATV